MPFVSQSSADTAFLSLYDENLAGNNLHLFKPGGPVWRRAAIGSRNICHTTFVNQFLDEADQTVVVTAKLFSVGKPLHGSQYAIQKRRTSLQVSESRSDAEGRRTEFQLRLITKSDAVKERIPVARAPVFNDVKPAGFQMVLEQMPEANPRQLADVRAVVNNHIKALRRGFASDAIQ